MRARSGPHQGHIRATSGPNFSLECTLICTNTNTQTHIHIYTHAHKYTCTHTHTHTQTHKHTNTHTHRHAHTHTHTLTHTHTRLRPTTYRTVCSLTSNTLLSTATFSLL